MYINGVLRRRLSLNRTLIHEVITLKFEIKGGIMKLELPVIPRLSKAGKSMLIASTSGRESFTFEGKTVHVNLNAYVPIEEWESKA